MYSVTLLLLSSELILHLLVLGLLEHHVAHLLLLNHFQLQVGLLLALNLEFLLSGVQELAIEVFLFLDVFGAELLTKAHLLVKHVLDLPTFLLHQLLLLLELLFVEALAELLDFAPLVVADVRGHVLYLDRADPIGKFS